MAHSDLTGVRCISVVRSALHSSIVALERQHLLNRAYAGRTKMIIVAEMFLEGVGHGIPKTVVQQLLQRKKDADDFDALLLTDLSRLARGSMHLENLMRALSKASIQIVTVDGAADIRVELLEVFADYSFMFVRQQRKLRRQCK